MVDQERISRALAPAVLQRRVYGRGGGLPVALAASGPATRDFTALEVQTLMAVALEPEGSSAELAETLAVERQSVRRAIAALERDGLLKVGPRDDDARYSSRRLTQAGRLAVERFVQHSDEQLAAAGWRLIRSDA